MRVVTNPSTRRVSKKVPPKVVGWFPFVAAPQKGSPFGGADRVCPPGPPPGKGLLEHSLAAAAMASAIFIVAWLLDAEIKPRPQLHICLRLIGFSRNWWSFPFGFTVTPKYGASNTGTCVCFRLQKSAST